MKKLLKLVVGLVVVLLVVALVLVSRIDSLAKSGIEKGGQYALGVETGVENVSVSLMSGTFDMAGLQIANPKGFESAPYLMRNGKFALAVNSGSFFSDTIEVPLIELDGLDLHVIKKGDQNNLSPILEHLKKFEGGQKAEESTGQSKKFIIKKLVIKNVKAHLDLPIVGTKTVNVPDITLENLTQDNANGMVLSEIMARIFPMITSAALASLGDLIPSDLAGVLKGDLAGVAQNLGGNIGEMIKDPTAALGKVTEQAGKVIDDAAKNLTDTVNKTVGEGAGDAVKEGADKLKKGLGGLLDKNQ